MDLPTTEDPISENRSSVHFYKQLIGTKASSWTKVQVKTSLRSVTKHTDYIIGVVNRIMIDGDSVRGKCTYWALAQL